MLWMYQIAVVFLVAVVIGLAVYAGYLIIKKSVWTRERFAFVALWANFAMATILIPTILGPDAWWVVVGNMTAELLGLQHRFSSAGSADKTAYVLLFVLLLYWTNNVFKHWDRATSERQNEQARKKEPTSLLQEGVWETRRLIRRQPSSPLAGQGSGWSFGKIWSSTAPQPWRLRAWELLSLRRPSYSFDSEDDWHEAHQMWIGENKRSGGAVGLLCVQSLAHLDDAQPAIDYLIRRSDGREAELVVASLNGTPSDGSELGGTLSGVPVTCFTEASLLDGLADFSDYFRVIKTRVERKHLPDSDLTIQDVYVPSQLLREQRSNCLRGSVRLSAHLA